VQKFFSILQEFVVNHTVLVKHAEAFGLSSFWVRDHIILPLNYDTDEERNGMDQLVGDLLT